MGNFFIKCDTMNSTNRSNKIAASGCDFDMRSCKWRNGEMEYMAGDFEFAYSFRVCIPFRWHWPVVAFGVSSVLDAITLYTLNCCHASSNWHIDLRLYTSKSESKASNLRHSIHSYCPASQLNYFEMVENMNYNKSIATQHDPSLMLDIWHR